MPGDNVGRWTGICGHGGSLRPPRTAGTDSEWTPVNMFGNHFDHGGLREE